MVVTTVRVAAAQYPIQPFTDWAAYCAHITAWVDDAVAAGAQLLLLPEYASAVLVSLAAPTEQINSAALPPQLAYLQCWRGAFLNLFHQLATTRQVYIAAGTYPVRQHDGRYVNRADWFQPDGVIAHQDKVQLTRFERDSGLIAAGDAVRVFATPFATIAIAICYDSEFPLLVRQLAELGADVIFVPSCTDTFAGYHRVRISCLARALENQFYVAQSVTIGAIDWSAIVETNCGIAGVYAPMDDGFPADGVLALGNWDQPQWVYADLDCAAIARVRRDGQVLNYRDWSAPSPSGRG